LLSAVEPMLGIVDRMIGHKMPPDLVGFQYNSQPYQRRVALAYHQRPRVVPIPGPLRAPGDFGEGT
jgi:hypothetical protein